jgi:putative oxidoreductase
MSLVRSLARPLLAGPFIFGGLDTLRHAKEKAHLAEPVTQTLSARFPWFPADPVAVTRYDAAVKVAAGVALAAGILPRLAALGLAVDLLPTTLAGHRFWAEEDPARRSLQRVQFGKNAGLLGGLLLMATDTGGRPSLAWRAQRLPRVVRHTARDLRRDTRVAVRSRVSAARDRLPV